MNPLVALPTPGLVWGRYPQRPDAAPGALQATIARTHAHGAAALQQLRGARLSGRQRGLLRAVRAEQALWSQFDGTAHAARLHDLRARLARDGWGGAWRAEALGCVAAAAQRSLARDPFDTQLLAADALLDDRLAEMATGEGKTLAAALAAAVAALAGVPVHAMTANDYLAARDAAALHGFYAALGLRVGSVAGTSTAEQRRAAYACCVTYCTAREVAFDHLRDGLGGASPPAEPLLRGLCMAVLDEADSLLIDEATLPLLLSERVDDAAQRAACFQALALARQLQPGRHVVVDAEAVCVRWLPAGEDHLQQAGSGLGGAWLNRRHRHDLVDAALEALHLLQRDRHYLVRGGRIELLDAVTGRVAPGRVWARGVQALVELKEGLAPSPATQTRAQISFQRFFARYVRLCGTSGTLAECRGELGALYGRRIVTIPVRLPLQRQRGPDRLFADAAARDAAVLRRVAALQRAGRPALVGTDSVGDTLALSQRLTAAGIAHRVLSARHDADEAAVVAQAGQPGAVTVATRMAGRGTDIALGPGVAALGGLHVLCCQDNLLRRLDRQLIGRCARQGDPGSAEVWRRLDAAGWHGALTSMLARIGRQPDEAAALRLPAALLRGWAAWRQAREERRCARARRSLLERDRAWMRQLDFSGAGR